MSASDKNTTLPTSGASVLAALVVGQLEAARSYGLPADELAAKSSIRPEDLVDPDGRVPEETWLALWEALDALPEAREFGIWQARAVTVQTLGVVGYAMQHAPDVRAAFGCLTRFRKLLGDAASPDIDELDECVLFHKVEAPRLARLSGLSLAVPLGTLALLYELTGLPRESPLALEATFQHPPPSDAARFRELLGCPVRFNSPETSISIHKRVFDLPLRRPDPSLYAYLERHARSLQAQLRDDHSLTQRVRQCLVERLRDGEPEQREIARLLGLHERTLQRRLRAEQTTFAQQLDNVRSELARMYLSDPQLAVFEIAYLLGFSEPSAFQRAFRRWTKQTPREYRRAHHLPKASESI